MTVIELSDEHAAALSAKAAVHGLSLEAWLKKLAEGAPTHPLERSQVAAARIREIQQRSKPDPEGWTVHDYINHGRR